MKLRFSTLYIGTSHTQTSIMFTRKKHLGPPGGYYSYRTEDLGNRPPKCLFPSYFPGNRHFPGMLSKVYFPGNAISREMREIENQVYK